MVLADVLHSIQRDKVGLELTLAVFPHIKIHRIINSYCEADGFLQFLQEQVGPVSELPAQ